jgi:hypothetical protein
MTLSDASAGLLYRLFPRLRARAIAREAARLACHDLLPGEAIMSASVCADEPSRYVVRVFCGERPASAEARMLPPWRECLIFAVTKNTYVAARVTDDEKYRPTIR